MEKDGGVKTLSENLASLHNYFHILRHRQKLIAEPLVLASVLSMAINRFIISSIIEQAELTTCGYCHRWLRYVARISPAPASECSCLWKLNNKKNVGKFTAQTSIYQKMGRAYLSKHQMTRILIRRSFTRHTYNGRVHATTELYQLKSDGCFRWSNVEVPHLG